MELLERPPEVVYTVDDLRGVLQGVENGLRLDASSRSSIADFPAPLAARSDRDAIPSYASPYPWCVPGVTARAALMG
jgi:hypothetical protein